MSKLTNEYIIIPLCQLHRVLQNVNYEALHHLPLTNYHFDLDTGYIVKVEVEFARSSHSLLHHLRHVQCGNSNNVCVRLPLFVYEQLFNNDKGLTAAELQRSHPYQLTYYDAVNQHYHRDDGCVIL